MKLYFGNGVTTATTLMILAMPVGEHWFHTGEQTKFLDNWIKKCREMTYSEPISS